MIKMLGVLMMVASAVFMLGYYLVESDRLSRVKFVKYVSIGMVCITLAVLILGAIVLLF